MRRAAMRGPIAVESEKVMTAATAFEEIEQLHETAGAAAMIDRLIETLRSEKNYHRLFDALLLKVRFEMGLPLVGTSSFDDVPAEKQAAFEERYVAAARDTGESLLAEGDIPQAWVYLRTIQEPEKVRAAIEALPLPDESDEKTEEIINIALNEGVHPVRGFELLLRTHGICNTITAFDQQAPQFSPGDRRHVAELLVHELYDDLCRTLRQEIEQKLAGVSPGETLRELLAGRDWLFEDGNYHIDVSHLNSVVRFARFLDSSSSELQQAIELAEYGTHLDAQFQYPGDPPFEEFYPAHVHYLNVLAGNDRDRGLAYFRDRIDAQTEEQDRAIVAYVLVDLLGRIDETDEALNVAETYLKHLDEGSGFSFSDLCRRAGRWDTLQAIARERGDLVSFAAALIRDRSDRPAT